MWFRIDMSSVSLCGQTHLKCSEKMKNKGFELFVYCIWNNTDGKNWVIETVFLYRHYCTHTKIFFFTHTQNDTFYHRTGVHICVSKGCCWGYGLWNGTHIITCRHVSSMWICREGECCNDHNGRKPAVVFLSCKTNHHHNSRISS